MSTKIIITSDETIICKACAEKFPLYEGVAQKTLERYEKEFDAEFQKRSEELRTHLEREAKKKAEKTIAAFKAGYDEKISERDEALDSLKNEVARAKKEARQKAMEESEVERKSLADELTLKNKALAEFKVHEVRLRKEKQALELEKQNLELTTQRKIDEQRNLILDEAQKIAEDKFRMKEAEYKKQITDAQKANETLSRKLDQKSQQLIGEVFELQLEQTLRDAFPLDEVEPVRKGVRGADVNQRVFNRSGQSCGSIIWESKRAENWSDKWLQKLKDDQVEEKAELAVLVTTRMPKDAKESFAIMNGVWVISEKVIKPVGETLRTMLTEAYKLKMANEGKNEKMELLYKYLYSPQFGQKMRVVVETFVNMRTDLEQEKRSIQKHWKKRESQIDRVRDTISGIVGELQAVAHEPLIQLDTIQLLQLPANDRIEGIPGDINAEPENVETPF